jgi:hypothetical protein
MTISAPRPPRTDKAMTQEGVPLLPGDGVTDEGAGVGIGAGLGGDGGRSTIEKDADVVTVLMLAVKGT